VPKGKNLLYQSPGEASIGETYMIGIALLDTLKDTDNHMVHKAADFLKSRQQAGGGFGFSKNNEHFPDSDDVSNAAYFFKKYNKPYKSIDTEKRIDRALEVLLTFQNKDGGFSTWEKESFGFLYRVLDHLNIGPELVLSESIVEHTARIILCLDQFKNKAPKFQRAYNKAVKWIIEQQQDDGSYEGTWFVNYFFGTSMVITALSTDDKNIEAKRTIDKALVFVLSHQNKDGGYSESPQSFDEKRPIKLAQSSPAQTGLIVSQLLTFINEVPNSHYKETLKLSIQRSIRYLLENQSSEGLWYDTNYTGVTFPGVEYLYYPYLQEAAAFHAIGLYRSIY
jgi:squalene cyclase